MVGSLWAILISTALFFICSCDFSKPEQVEIIISVKHEEGVDCKTYLADYYEVELFDSMQKKVDQQDFECHEGLSELSISAEKGEYYFTVSLKDDGGSIKSFGSGTADASASDISVSVDMAEFKGAVTFSWNNSDCSSYDISFFKFTMLNEGQKVSAIIWGKETEVSEFPVNCEAESFSVVNIDPGLYSAEAEAFRLADSENPRIIYDIKQFKQVSGQTAVVKMNDSKEVVVSDLILSWEFDSKSIAKCSVAGINSVIASLISDDDTFTLTDECDDEFSKFKFYDIPENSYEILLRGMDDSGNTLFESSTGLEIKKGFIGNDALEEIIYLRKK